MNEDPPKYEFFQPITTETATQNESDLVSPNYLPIITQENGNFEVFRNHIKKQKFAWYVVHNNDFCLVSKAMKSARLGFVELKIDGYVESFEIFKKSQGATELGFNEVCQSNVNKPIPKFIYLIFESISSRLRRDFKFKGTAYPTSGTGYVAQGNRVLVKAEFESICDRTLSIIVRWPQGEGKLESFDEMDDCVFVQTIEHKV